MLKSTRAEVSKNYNLRMFYVEGDGYFLEWVAELYLFNSPPTILENLELHQMSGIFTCCLNTLQTKETSLPRTNAFYIIHKQIYPSFYIPSIYFLSKSTLIASGYASSVCFVSQWLNQPCLPYPSHDPT